MKSLGLAGYALAMGAAAALLAGCGALRQAQDDMQPPIGVPGAMLQSGAMATHAAHGKSWMLPEAVHHDLLYIANTGVIYVYRYPRLKLLGTIGGLAGISGECVDKSGDVFVVDSYYGAYEYRHGGTMPIASFYSQTQHPIGCSIDPTTGSLAISGGESPDPIVAIFPYSSKRGWRYPKFFKDSTFSYALWCGYDDKGNLFVDGTPKSTGLFQLAELRKGRSTLTNLKLNQSFHSAGGVQWDGKYMTVGDSQAAPPVVYQFVVSGREGTVVGSTSLAGSMLIDQYWIQGNNLIGPDGLSNDVGFWSYPGGGDPTTTIALPYASAAVVSPRQTAK